MRRTRVTETSPSALLQLPDDVLLEIVALLDVDCSSVWPNLCSLRCSSQRLRRLCEAPSLMARLSKVHCTCEWGLRLIVATTFEPHAAALRRLHLARHWWRISFEGLFGLAPKDCDLREAPSRGSGLGKAVLQAARTNRKALLEFFWVVFQCMRDVALLRSDGLCAKELILLRMVVAAPCAVDALRITSTDAKRSRTVRGERFLDSLMDLAEVFIAEFFKYDVQPNAECREDYVAAASAYQWLARSIYTVVLNERSYKRVYKAIYETDNRLFELAAERGWMDSIFIYPTNLPLFELCSDRFGDFPRPTDWDQKLPCPPPGHTVVLRPLPFRFKSLPGDVIGGQATVA